MQKIISFMLILLWVCGGQVSAQTVLRGTIRDATAQTPVTAAQVTVGSVTAQTDTAGRFSLSLPAGRHQLLASRVGYQAKTFAELLTSAAKETVLDFYLTATTTQLAEVVVTAASPNLSGAVTSLHTLTPEQILRYPATFMDPARLVQAYAGVVNTNDQANGLSVRGNSPATIQWRLEGVEIVNPNHLTNAGTFTDRSAPSGGGVNMLSAQLLGNMNFLTGAFPAEYGNVIGGVLDMRLRQGNVNRREHTAQVGLLGIDLATEGPLSKRGGSYLLNYRYSFTGILGLMGISFGGEKISFQDFSMHVALPKIGKTTVRLFGMGGNSANLFTGKYEPEKPEVEKDLFNINYRGKMGVAGITAERPLSARTVFTWTTALSGFDNQREQYLIMPAFASSLGPSEKDGYRKQLLSNRLQVTSKLSASHSLKTGVYFTAGQWLSSLSVSPVTTISSATKRLRATLFQPYAQWDWALTPAVNLQSGLHITAINGGFLRTEPRLAASFQVHPKHRLGVAAGLHSQLVEMGEFSPRADLYFPVTTSTQLAVNYQWQLPAASSFKTELYWQDIANVNQTVGTQGPNVVNGVPDFYKVSAAYMNPVRQQNRGVELTYQKLLQKNFFWLVNASVFQVLPYVEGFKEEEFRTLNAVANLMAGNEWATRRGHQWGLNGRLAYYNRLSGNTQLWEEMNGTLPIKKYYAYFRPDVRAYYRINRNRASHLISLDIQNVANYQNPLYDTFDSVQKRLRTVYQLGLIPMLNYRIEFSR